MTSRTVISSVTSHMPSGVYVGLPTSFMPRSQLIMDDSITSLVATKSLTVVSDEITSPLILSASFRMASTRAARMARSLFCAAYFSARASAGAGAAWASIAPAATTSMSLFSVTFIVLLLICPDPSPQRRPGLRDVSEFVLKKKQAG